MISPTPAQILLLADEHIRHYSRMLDAAAAGDTTVVPGETRMYRAIWQRIKEKGGVGLNTTEMGEVVDACFCGDFEHIVPLLEEDAEADALRCEGQDPFDPLNEADLH